MGVIYFSPDRDGKKINQASEKSIRQSKPREEAACAG